MGLPAVPDGSPSSLHRVVSRFLPTEYTKQLCLASQYFFLISSIKARASSSVLTGRGNMLTGYIRQRAGQSGSSLIRHGAKLVAKGTKIVNKARGISSVVGTLATVRENALFGELFS